MGADIVRCASLKLEGQSLKGSVFKGDAGNHLAAALIGRHAVQQFLLAVEHTNAGRSIDFVTGEGEEVAVNVLHVHREVGHALCTVHKDAGAVGVSHRRHLLHRIHRAEHVADVGDGDEAGARCEEFFVSLQIHLTGIVDGNDFEDNPFALPHELPRNDVAVVFHDRQQDFVALPEERLGEGRSDEVQALGRAPCENDFGRRGSADETSHPFAGGFVKVGGLLRKEVHAAVHVGIDGEIFLAHRIDNAAWLLSRGGVVQIDQRAVIDLSFQNGKVGTYFFNIKHGVQ